MANGLVDARGFNLVADVPGAFARGEALVQQREDTRQKGLTTQILEGQVAQIPQQAEAAGLQLQGRKEQAAVDTETRTAQAMIQGAGILKTIQSPEAKLNFLEEQRTRFESAGLSTQPIDQAIQLARAGDFESLAANTDRLIALSSQLGGGKIQQAVSVPGVGFGVLTKSGQARLQEFPQEDQERITEALEAEGRRKATAAGLKKRSTLEEDLALKPKIKAEEVAAKIKAETANIGARNAVDIASKGLDGFKTELTVSDTILGDINRAIEIWQSAPGTISGPFVSRLPALADDTQELESILAQLGIDRLSSFKGATSEKEMATAFRAGASIEQNATAGIKRLRVQKKALEANRDRLVGNINEANNAIRGFSAESEQQPDQQAAQQGEELPEGTVISNGQQTFKVVNGELVEQ